MRVFLDANILFSASNPKWLTSLLLDVLELHGELVTSEFAARQRGQSRVLTHFLAEFPQCHRYEVQMPTRTSAFRPRTFLRERLALGQLFVFGKCVGSRFLRDSAIVTPCGEGAADEVRASNPGASSWLKEMVSRDWSGKVIRQVWRLHRVQSGVIFS